MQTFICHTVIVKYGRHWQSSIHKAIPCWQSTC